MRVSRRGTFSSVSDGPPELEGDHVELSAMGAASNGTVAVVRDRAASQKEGLLPQRLTRARRGRRAPHRARQRRRCVRTRLADAQRM